MELNTVYLCSLGYHKFIHYYKGKTTVSVLLKNVSEYRCHPRSVVAYSAEVAYRVVPMR